MSIIFETIARLPGPIRGSLGRNRENRHRSRSTSPSRPQLSELFDPKPDCVGRAQTARYPRYSVLFFVLCPFLIASEPGTPYDRFRPITLTPLPMSRSWWYAQSYSRPDFAGGRT